MFPRTAIVILILLLATPVVIFVRGMSVAKQANCQRNIAEPYRMLLDRMRVLADAGRTEELHALIVKAQEHIPDVRTVCSEQQREDYAMEVYQWTR